MPHPSSLFRASGVYSSQPNQPSQTTHSPPCQPGKRPRLLPVWGAEPTALAVLAVLLLGFAGCSLDQPGRNRAITYAHPVPTGVTFDMQSGRELTPQELDTRLAQARIVFLGEHHTDPRSHRFQIEVLRRLAASGRKVIVALEFFPPTSDPLLDKWRRGQLKEKAFVEQADWFRHWGFPWAHYRDVFQAIRKGGFALHGVNASPETRKAVSKGDLKSLPDPMQKELGDLNTPLPAHREYVLDAMNNAGHGAVGDVDSPRFKRFYRVQRMWDRLMGLRTVRLAEQAMAKNGASGKGDIARSTKRGKSPVVVLLVGSGHLAYGLGANLQAARESMLPQLTVWDTVVAADQLNEQGHYNAPLGISPLVRVYARDKSQLGYPSLAGVKLEKTNPEGNAQKKQGEPGVGVLKVFLPSHAPLSILKPGDRILALNGTTMAATVDLRLAFEALPFNEKATMRIIRAGKTSTLTFTPKSSPHR